MPLIDLSDLDGAELRSLLDSARRQGHAAQSYEILQEMEARRHRRAGPRMRSPKAGTRPPRTISLELGDPLDRKEELAVDRMNEDLPPLTLAEGPTPRKAPKAAPDARRPRGWAHWGALIFALGLAGGVAAGWWAADFANGGRPLAPSPVPGAPAPVQTAALPPAAPSETAEPPVSLAPEAAQVSPAPPPPPAVEATATVPAPAAQPAAAAAAQPAAAAATPPSPEAAAPVQPSESAATPDKACDSEPTPADRTICADPKLRRLQMELRQAYADALKAHEDRALLRQHELAWRDARSAVTDPAELATLYRERIAKLQAATTDALRRR